MIVQPRWLWRRGHSAGNQKTVPLPLHLVHHVAAVLQLDAFGHAGAENLRRRLITGHYAALPGSALAWLTFWHTCSGNTRYESDRQADATFAAIAMTQPISAVRTRDQRASGQAVQNTVRK